MDPLLAAVDKTYTDARAKYPKATIIAVGPSTPGAVDATVRALDEAVHNAAAKVGAKYVSLINPDVLDDDGPGRRTRKRHRTRRRSGARESRAPLGRIPMLPAS